MTMQKDTVSEILRTATSKKPVRVPINAVTIKPELNVREPDMGTWDIDGIAGDLALNGQKEPVLLEKLKDGTFMPWRGFRRTAGVKQNADRGVIDPQTGNKFDSVLAFVIDEELTEKERMALLLDAGNTRALSKVEVFYAVERADKVWDTADQIAIATRGLLDQHFPVRDEEVLKDEKRYADYRRGVIGNLLNAARAPFVLREEFIKQLRRKQSWPSAKEVRTLQASFRKKADADTTKKINRSNPGKEWMAEWNAFVAKKKKDEAEGRKPKSQAMMSQDDVSTLQSKVESRILKVVFSIVRRQISQENLASLDNLLVDVESGKATPEQVTAALDEITATIPQEEVVTGE